MNNFLNTCREKCEKIPILNHFADKHFFNYTWISILFSLLNILLLWLFIDIFHIPTIISSVVVIGGTFLLRYVLFKIFKIM